jgi:hypothetical protein
MRLAGILRDDSPVRAGRQQNQCCGAGTNRPAENTFHRAPGVVSVISFFNFSRFGLTSGWAYLGMVA